MFCQNCGTEINEETKFCPNCGTKTNSTQTTEQKNQEIPKTAQLSHYGSSGVYEFLRTMEPNLDFIWAKSGNDGEAIALLGLFSVFIVNTYILAFNTENIYVCKLSKISGENIVNINKYAWSEIKSFTARGVIVGKKLTFITDNGKFNFRTQKIFSMENQGERIEKLLQMQK